MAGVKDGVVCSVVLAADWFTVGVVVDVEETFEQLPSLLGRQLEHCFPAFTQAQPLHEPVLLHLQQSTISRVQRYCGHRRRRIGLTLALVLGLFTKARNTHSTIGSFVGGAPLVFELYRGGTCPWCPPPLPPPM